MSTFLSKERYWRLIVALRRDGQGGLADLITQELEQQTGGVMACVFLPIATIALYSGEFLDDPVVVTADVEPVGVVRQFTINPN